MTKHYAITFGPKNLAIIFSKELMLTRMNVLSYVSTVVISMNSLQYMAYKYHRRHMYRMLTVSKVHVFVFMWTNSLTKNVDIVFPAKKLYT